MEPGQELPPPSLLKRKIIIKNKKKHHHHHKKHKKKQQTPVTEFEEEARENEDNGVTNQVAEGENGPPPDIVSHAEAVDNNGQQIGNGDISHPPMLQQRQSSKDSTQDDEG